jgi:hypothetical protein
MGWLSAKAKKADRRYLMWVEGGMLRFQIHHELAHVWGKAARFVALAFWWGVRKQACHALFFKLRHLAVQGSFRSPRFHCPLCRRFVEQHHRTQEFIDLLLGPESILLNFLPVISPFSTRALIRRHGIPLSTVFCSTIPWKLASLHLVRNHSAGKHPKARVIAPIREGKEIGRQLDRTRGTVCHRSLPIDVEDVLSKYGRFASRIKLSMPACLRLFHCAKGLSVQGKRQEWIPTHRCLISCVVRPCAATARHAPAASSPLRLRCNAGCIY